ncbi:MAG: M28 family peptidase [Steroidobacteraceae bacterium]
MRKPLQLFSGVLAACLATLGAAQPAGTQPNSDPAAPALAVITGQKLLSRIGTLASDDFEGRSPGSHGEDMTVDYLVGQFKAAGLAPGNPDGSYIQKVPMTAFSSKPSVSFKTGADKVQLKTPDDYVGWSSVRRKHLLIKDSPLLFVGYGVQAPEFNWDDYKGIDLKGKTLIMLINDPPIPDPKDASQLDQSMFGGKAMTYYGRWTYKFEIAAKLGATAAIIVHETGPAAYPYSVVVSSWNGENFSLRTRGPNPDFPTMAGWMTLDVARALFARNGLDFDTLKQQALSRSFQPVALKSTVSFDVRNSWRELDSRNVVARLPGSDPQRAGETVIYSAHWDHFGWNRTLPGSKSDQVFHGAADNASGTAALLTLGEAFKALPVAPARSVLFIATTGEERGLLGAAYYARHPLYPLRTTVADINMDVINTLGRTRDVELVGFGKSEMDDIATQAIEAQGRRVVSDLHPERGSFYRADQLEFARVGIPVLYAGGGLDFVGQPASYGDDKKSEYIAKRYHQVADVIQPDWTLEGGAQDVQMLFNVGLTLASTRRFPQWKAGAEFKAARDAMLTLK